MSGKEWNLSHVLSSGTSSHASVKTLGRQLNVELLGERVDNLERAESYPTASNFHVGFSSTWDSQCEGLGRWLSVGKNSRSVGGLVFIVSEVAQSQMQEQVHMQSRGFCGEKDGLGRRLRSSWAS